MGRFKVIGDIRAIIGKKRIIAILIVVSVAVCALGFLYFNNKGSETGSGLLLEDTAGNAADQSDFVAAQNEKLEKIEGGNIEVYGNTPEFDLKAQLFKTSSGNPFLRLEYYLDGSSTTRDIDSLMISELGGSSQTIKLYLNSTISKLYVFISAKSTSDKALFVLKLSDARPELLFRGSGDYSGFEFSKDRLFLAYNSSEKVFGNNIGNYQSFFSIIDCETDRFVVSKSRIDLSRLIGSIDDKSDSLSITFMGWKDEKTAILQLSEGENQLNVLYDLKGNSLASLDGSELQAVWKQGAGQAAEDQLPDSAAAAADSTSGALFDSTAGALFDSTACAAADSTAGGAAADGASEITAGAGDASTDGSSDTSAEAASGNSGEGLQKDSTAGGQNAVREAEKQSVKALEAFYRALSDEKTWNDAMALLDEGFTIKLALFQQYGIEELKKSDINSSDASLYSSILKTAKYDILISNKAGTDSATLSYYQLLGDNEATRLRQELTAGLVKKSGRWLITYIKETGG
ncbi:MAG: hypothetical protein HGA22_01240 [Clostridiales bacterium]|nr:hypothetical protein [Clostridiales bacterium]